MNGCSAIVWCTAPPRIPSPLVINSTMPGSVGDTARTSLPLVEEGALRPSRDHRKHSLKRVELALEHVALPLAGAEAYGGLEVGAGLVGAAEAGEQLAA